VDRDDEHGGFMSNSGVVECRQDSSDVRVVERGRRIARGGFRAIAMLGGIDVVEVERQESRHPVADHLTRHLGPGFIQDDDVAAFESLEQSLASQFVLEPLRRIGERARDVGGFVVDRSRAASARPVDRRGGLPGLPEEGRKDWLR
jgi:hypothetical protein